MKSFGVWYKKQEGAQIDPVFSIHVNFWSNSIKKDSSCADLDIGIKISKFKDVEEVVFHCPFLIQEGDVRDLYEKLTKKKNANIVFNAEGEIATRESFAVYKMSEDDRDKFLLFCPMNQLNENIYKLNNKDGNTDITFDMGRVNKILKKKKCFDDISDIYIRFRITTNALKNSIYFDSEPLNKSFDSAFSGTRVIDFKINENRNLGEVIVDSVNLEQYEWPEFEAVHLLVMEPSSYDVESIPNEKMTCRELEADLWDDYYESNMDSSKGHILAYHWKWKESKSPASLIKVKYSRTKKSILVAYSLVVVALGALGSLIVSFVQSFGCLGSAGFASVVFGIIVVLFVIGMIIGKK